MSKDFSKFDEFKKELGKRWTNISVYNTTEILNLVVDSFKPYVFALLNKGMDVNYHFKKAFKQIENRYLYFKISEKDKAEEKLNGTLKRYMERGS